jgi:hypothetical protein
MNERAVVFLRFEIFLAVFENVRFCVEKVLRNEKCYENFNELEVYRL